MTYDELRKMRFLEKADVDHTDDIADALDGEAPPEPVYIGTDKAEEIEVAKTAYE